jgi:hypothetical protein
MKMICKEQVKGVTIPKKIFYLAQAEFGSQIFGVVASLEF